MRLNKYIASAGVCSRRKADELIANGNVKVNGASVREHGVQVEPGDVVAVNGKVIEEPADKIYVAVNKPLGYITSMDDDKGRATVAELVDDIPERLFPVGRLDYNTTGLLIMTNDGNFANAITHPSRRISKAYRVSVRPKVTDEQITVLTSSMMIDGRETYPAEVRVVSNEPDKSVLEVILHEGRNRQIRRLCEAAGLETVRLKRIAIGQLTLGHLRPGEYRELTKDEVSLLKRQSGRF